MSHIQPCMGETELDVILTFSMLICIALHHLNKNIDRSGAMPCPEVQQHVAQKPVLHSILAHSYVNLITTGTYWRAHHAQDGDRAQARSYACHQLWDVNTQCHCWRPVFTAGQLQLSQLSELPAPIPSPSPI